ncbi:MAG: ATP-dependent RNA helicase [Deltaproteobacteria bacterium]|nr:ATP-dependent RNA helicase [Deltaproteobacteria bacterium]
MADALPIHRIREAFLAALAPSDTGARRPIVVTSPTGSGKSTEIPRWCPGRVLVVEPRRIACRSLAARVAELERTEVGDGVGYVVRDERVLRDATRIVFATPGIVLRDRALLASAGTVILDELHERNLETDLLLALVPRHTRAALVVMSATIESERVASHLGGALITADGRTFPVEIRHPAGQPVVPDAEDLVARVRATVGAASRDAGDVLVFLPGKGEIEACAQALRGPGVEILPLHGELSVAEQRRVFAHGSARKVILATNVAETSLTIPGVGVVIDSGLVRRTRYHDGRGFLTLVPIAEDSAAQRAGRAGRTGPGVCYRLWSSAARLEATTPPEIHRESLVPLVMAAAAWGERPEDLPLLDPPKPYALEAARADLAAWGALAGHASSLSPAGRSLFAMPIAPAHARLLVAARAEDCVEDAIDLVAALSVSRAFFVDAIADDVARDDDLRASGCDATALIRAVRVDRPDEYGLSSIAVREARQTRARLRRMEGLTGDPRDANAPIAREALIRATVAADPRVAHVARPRGRDVFFSNGGTELALARQSAARRLKSIDALLVLDTRALGAGRDQRILVTAGMAVPLGVLAATGLGEDRLGAVSVVKGRVIAVVERVFAQRVIGEREEVPRGQHARDAIVTLLARGSLFKSTITTTRERLGRLALAARLHASGHPAGVPSDAPSLELEPWLHARLTSLGVESGEDLALLSEPDLLAPELPYESRTILDKEMPATVTVGDATYRASYDLSKKEVLLEMLKGSRKDPPPLQYLPAFPGLRILVSSSRGTTVLRDRR